MQALLAKHNLIMRQTALQQRLSALETDLQKSYNRDSSEQVTERENDEVLEAIASETARELHQIEKVLAKMGTDDYGSCEECGKPIGEERLKIVPEATTCISCARSH